MQLHKSAPESPLLPVWAAAELLQVTPTTVRAWIKKGYLPNIRIGSRSYILRNQLENIREATNAS